MLGMGIAVTTMVGQQLGRDRPELAARATWTSFCMAQAYLSFMAALYVLVPDLFLLGHASGTSPEEFAQLRDTTVVLLRFVAAYSLLDALNVIFVGAIKGAGDTRFILAVNAIMSPLPVLAGWAGITYCGWGLIWCWGVITTWICALGLIYLARFLQGRWRQMRVIEPVLNNGLPTDDRQPPPPAPTIAQAVDGL
jgi:MATE family multidrug resistance protein